MFLIIGLQDTMPVKLGTVGTFILSSLFIVSALLNIWLLYKRKNEELLNTALHTTQAEMDVYKSRSERLHKENTELNQQVGELKAKTDLSQVIEMLSVTVDLSRKFDRENSQLNANIVKSLEKHGESDKEIFGSIDQSLKETAATLRELKTEIQDHRKNASVMIETVLKEIRKARPRHE